MELTKTVLKIILTATNAVLTLIGIAYLVIGIHMCVSQSLTNYPGIFIGSETLRSMNLILIFTGCFILLLCALGIAASWLEHGTIMNAYLVLLIVTLIPLVVILILTIIKDKQVNTFVTVRIRDRLMIYYGSVREGPEDSAAFTDGIDAFQSEQMCCGWFGSSTGGIMFKATPWYQQQVNKSAGNPQLYPNSCCTQRVLNNPDTMDTCVRPADAKAARSAGFLHSSDCSERLSALNGRYTRLIVVLTLIGFLVLGVGIACDGLFLVREVKGWP